jgi:hypothetical protein
MKAMKTVVTKFMSSADHATRCQAHELLKELLMDAKVPLPPTLCPLTAHMRGLQQDALTPSCEIGAGGCTAGVTDV